VSGGNDTVAYLIEGIDDRRTGRLSWRNWTLRIEEHAHAVAYDGGKARERAVAARSRARISFFDGRAAVLDCRGVTAEETGYRYPESIAAGEVVEVDLEARLMIIEGYRYPLRAGIPVQIGGSASDVSLLTPRGMLIQYRFLRVPDDLREVVEIRQVPPGVQIPGSDAPFSTTASTLSAAGWSRYARGRSATPTQLLSAGNAARGR